MGTHPIFESDFDCLTEKLNEEMSMSSMDLASARTLILAFLTNSDDDATADFAEHNLKTLELSGKIESFLHIVECGHEFAKIYDLMTEKLFQLGRSLRKPTNSPGANSNSSWIP